MIRDKTSVAAAGGQQALAWSSALDHPTAFAAADSIHQDGAEAGGRIKWHYCIVEVILEACPCIITFHMFWLHKYFA